VIFRNSSSPSSAVAARGRLLSSRIFYVLNITKKSHPDRSAYLCARLIYNIMYIPSTAYIYICIYLVYIMCIRGICTCSVRVDLGGHSCQAAEHQRRAATPAGSFVFCLHRRHAFKGGEPIVILHVRKEPAAAAANTVYAYARARIYLLFFILHTHTHRLICMTIILLTIILFLSLSYNN